MSMSNSEQIRRMKKNRRRGGALRYSDLMERTGRSRSWRRKETTEKIPLHNLCELNSTLGSIIASYLQAFKEASALSGATPSPFCFQRLDGKTVICMEQAWQRWSQALDKMIWSFSEYARLDSCTGEFPEAYRRRLQEGLDLFAEHYRHLQY